MSLDFFKEFDLTRGIGEPRDRRQDSARNERGAADPVDKREDVQNAGDDEIVHNSLLRKRARAAGEAVATARDTQ